MAAMEHIMFIDFWHLISEKYAKQLSIQRKYDKYRISDFISWLLGQRYDMNKHAMCSFVAITAPADGLALLSLLQAQGWPSASPTYTGSALIVG